MDPKDYRRQVEGELEAAARRKQAAANVLSSTEAPAAARQRALESLPASRSDFDVAQALTIVDNTSESATVRARAIANLGILGATDPNITGRLLAMLADSAEPTEVRLAALGVLQQISFRPNDFAALRPKFLLTLRSLSAEPDMDIRRKVVGILAREHDGDTQKRLIAGLKDPKQALVPPAKALQFLGYDPHADAISVAREIVKQAPDEEARLAALRILAADAASRDLFVNLLQNRSESSEVRRLAIAALHALDPKALQSFARSCAVDPTDDDEVRAACVVALTSFGEKLALEQDDELKVRVDELANASPSEQAKRGARQFIKKYGR
jgi:hypothetical protein